MAEHDEPVRETAMSKTDLNTLAFGLSEAEKDDLEKMIGEFRRQRQSDADTITDVSIQTRLNQITQRLVDLTETVLAIDRQMASIVEIIRLSHQKSERLNQRLDAVIAALKKGHKL